MKQKLLCCLLFVFATAGMVHGQQQDQQLLSGLMAQVQNAYDANSDSLEYYAGKALPLAIKLGNIDAEIRSQRLWAIKTYLAGNSDAATKILLDVARDAEKKPVSIESAHLFYAISQVYGINSYGAISEKYLRKGLAIALDFKDNVVIADGYNRMGITYERKEKYDSALYYYEQSLQYNDKAKELLGKAYSLENIAGIYAKRKQLNKALGYQKEALAYKLQLGKKIDLSLAYINIAETYDSLKQYDSTMSYIAKALALGKEIDFKDLVKYAYQFLSNIYERQGKYDLALQMHKKYTELNDTIYNEAKTKQLAEFNAKYQAEKNEQQINELQQRTTIQRLQLKQRNFLLFIAIGLFIAGVVIAYLTYNRRRLKEQATLQAEINKQQAIATRQVFMAEEKERKRIAADLHDGVGQLMSAALLNLNTFFSKQNISGQTDQQAGHILSLITDSYDELRSISHQMMPNALVKGGLDAAVKELASKINSAKLSVTIETQGLDSGINDDVETVLYRVLQECINNVIKHANATEINIQVVKDEEGISATIEDNGKGFDANSLKQGIGLKNIYSRVQFLNGTTDIDSHPGKGTLIAIHIPA